MAAVVEDPMAEMDMESSPEGEIDEGSRLLAVCLSLQRGSPSKQASQSRFDGLPGLVQAALSAPKK